MPTRKEQVTVKETLLTYPKVEFNGINLRAKGQEISSNGSLGSIK